MDWLDETGLVALPGGARVRGRRLADPASPADFALVLAGGPAPAWPHRRVRWPDFGVPTDRDDALDALHEAHRRANGRRAGRGRLPRWPRPHRDRRAAEVIAALSLATDLGIGVPLEHGLQSTLIAMRLGERLGVDPDTASQTYYACLLFYVGCTADAEVAAETFGDDDALTRRHAGQVRVAAGDERGDHAGACATGQPGAGAGHADRAWHAEGGQGVQGPYHRVLRGGPDADRPARPARVHAGPVRLPGRALGRQGPARPCQARGDPAAGADRLGGPRRRVPAHARRPGSSPPGWSAGGRGRVRPGRGHPAGRCAAARSWPSTPSRSPGRRRSPASRARG